MSEEQGYDYQRLFHELSHKYSEYISRVVLKKTFTLNIVDFNSLRGMHKWLLEEGPKKESVEKFQKMLHHLMADGTWMTLD